VPARAHSHTCGIVVLISMSLLDVTLHRSYFDELHNGSRGVDHCSVCIHDRHTSPELKE